MTENGEKAEVLSAAFASVFKSENNCSQGTQPPKLKGRGGGAE